MDLVVAADDRTGAFEVAGRLADVGNGPVTVTAWPNLPDADEVSGDEAGLVTVVDLASRHLSQREARHRATSLGRGARAGHKIDSALRGNWADELAGRAEQSPVLLVPALPEFGRVCIGGEVLDHGRPVHEGSAGSDVRRRVTSSHPADLLRAAGVGIVGEVADLERLAAWLADPVGVVVADAQTDDDISRILELWESSAGDVVLAGPSSVVGRARVGDLPATPLPEHRGPVLLVCGSVHPSARAQLAFLERRGTPVTTLADDITAHQLADHGAVVLVTEIPVGDVDEPMAIAAAASLARGVADLRSRVDIAALVVIGGDTAAAVLGGGSAVVHGTAGPGTAWATVGDDPLPVITRSGGFGSEAALDELLRDLQRP
ncbi:MAG TPA: four-carbon acid sugar kinase family protein [Ilumatobacter sp.]|nr:four-carbon acid sugar kinase family protein [Ilumatobacter sp.]